MPRSRLATITAVAFIMVMAAGCTKDVPQVAAESAPPPQPTRQESAPQTTEARPSATLPDGSHISLELATTPEEIANGLMFRPTLPPDRGMLFVFDQERLPSFWMKNTLIPLDMVFLDGNGAVVDVVMDAQPCKVEPCPQYVPKRPAAAVLELAAGQAKAHNVTEGATLEFDRVAGYPAP